MEFNSGFKGLMPPILLCWPTTSEANIVYMAEEVEPSRQYSVKFCCRATDDSRGAVWQNGVWHGSAYETKMCNWIPPCGKNCTKWHSPTLAERLRRLNSGCQHSEAVGGAFQQWRQRRERQATFRRAMDCCHTTKRRASRSTHPRESADYD